MFVPTLIPDRKKETLEKAFKRYILTGSKIVTDGYPSYVPAVKEFRSQHVIVNRTAGSVNEDGFTTNKIENVWSHRKPVYRKRNGLNHNLISGFVEEF